MEGALREGADRPGLTLIETMLWDGAAMPRLALHMARLARGAEALGWPLDPDEVQAALGAAAPDAPSRVRLTLDARGKVSLTRAALPPAKALWRVGLAQQRLRSADPWLGHKTSHRPAYDAARAALPPDLDEVVLLNERGEVCDGSISTLFFDRGEGMRTPPLSSGVLPGVLRAALAVPEEVLMAAELPGVRLWMGNALRGLIPAVWVAQAG